MFTTVLLFYAPVMLGLLLWNGLACLLVFRRRRLDPRRFRYLYYLVLLLMLPGLVCDVGGMSPDAAIMLGAAWLYPGVFFLAALASIALLRRDGFRWWLVPVPLLNLWLGVIYLTRYLSYLGIPLGLAFDGMQVAYAIVQSLTVIFLYILTYAVPSTWATPRTTGRCTSGSAKAVRRSTLWASASTRCFRPGRKWRTCCRKSEADAQELAPTA